MSCIKKPEKIRIISRKCINDITVNTTELFRDVPVWMNLRRNVLNIFKEKTTSTYGMQDAQVAKKYTLCSYCSMSSTCWIKPRFLPPISIPKFWTKPETVFSTAGLHHAYFDNFDKVIKVNPLNFEEKLTCPIQSILNRMNSTKLSE
jgi:chemotaxis protein methyltransferase CheR